MRLVYLSDSPLPSREANSFHVMRMCQAFAKEGHEVVLIAQNCPVFGEPGIADVFAFYGVEPLFEIHRIARKKIRGWGFLYGWQAAREALRRKPDLLYSRNLWGAFFTARGGLPTVFEAHTLKFLFPPFHRRISTRMMQYPAFSHLVVISGALRGDCLETLQDIQSPFPGERILVAHDGADPLPSDAFPTDKSTTGEKSFRVGYCGSLYPGKGAEILPALARQCPWAEFVLVGGSEQALSEYRQTHQIPSNLTLKGFLPPTVATRECLACNVLLAPLQRTIEVAEKGMDIARWTSPLKIFEYMACGKAILCSDLPVLREILEHNRTTLFLPPDDLKSWSDALLRLQAEPALGKRLGEEARQTFQNKFTWDQRAKNVLQPLLRGAR